MCLHVLGTDACTQRRACRITRALAFLHFPTLPRKSPPTNTALHREEHLHFLVYLHAANALSRGHRSIRRTGTYISQKPHNSHSLPQKQEQHISDILVSCRGSHLTACSHVTATSAPASSAFCVHATIQKAPVISATPCGGFRHEHVFGVST